MSVIGAARPRLDAPDKVTGATRFAADGQVHGLLHARLVLASEPHARLRGIDREAGERVKAAAQHPVATVQVGGGSAS